MRNPRSYLGPKDWTHVSTKEVLVGVLARVEELTGLTATAVTEHRVDWRIDDGCHVSAGVSDGVVSHLTFAVPARTLHGIARALDISDAIWLAYMELGTSRPPPVATA
jgi:hypothetical protein